jgi:uncharacterized RmlC-like cupin family protein
MRVWMVGLLPVSSPPHYPHLPSSRSKLPCSAIVIRRGLSNLAQGEDEAF